jgi:CBS domain-containing protein
MLGNRLKSIAVSRVMTDFVISVNPDTPMNKVDEIFQSERIHHLPVVNELSEVVGMMSRREYYMLQDHFTLFGTDSAKRSNQRILSSLLVKEIMQKHPITILDTANLKDAYGVFRENLIHALPVVDKSNKLKGILTTMDLLRYAYAEETQLLT